MCRKVGREDVKNQIKRPVRIKVKFAYEADDFAPDMICASMYVFVGFRRCTDERRMRRTHATCELNDKLAVTFRLFPQKVKFVLFIAVG